MSRCASCQGDIADLVERQRVLQVAKAVDSFPFVCPHCRGWFMLEVDAAGEACLVLEEKTGVLRTPSLVGELLDDAEMRELLLECIEDRPEPDPSTMTPEERKTEAARILTRGYLRKRRK